MLPKPSLTNQGFSSNVVLPTGSGTNHVYLVGEAPGETEDRYGVPFHPQAPAGSVLERILRRAGLVRDNFRLGNVVWQRPPHNYLEGASWEAEAIEAWRPELDADIAQVKPRVLIALGNTALKALTSYGGRGSTVTAVRGFAVPAVNHDAWVVPTYHPSFILQGQQALTGVVIHDISKALEIARKGFTRARTWYTTNPTPAEAENFANIALLNPDRYIAYDIETPESGHLDEEEIEEKGASYTILRISFSFQRFHAITMPWQQPYIDIAKRLLASPNKKRTWNGNFDNPRLRANGCVINGRHYDVMWLWKHLQPALPRNLQFVSSFYTDMEPWKHLSDSQPEFYSCADSDSLTRVGEGVELDLRAKNVWQRYERHVVDLSSVLEKMSANGLPIDKDKVEAFRVELKAKYDERFLELQRLVPDELKPNHPKKGFKRVPATVSAAELAWVRLDRAQDHLDPDDIPLDERLSTPLEFITKQTGMRLIRVKDFVKVLRDPTAPPQGCDTPVSRLVETEVERWAKVLPWLPTSWQQVQAYAKSKGHKLGRRRKTQKETTDEETLKKLYRRHKDEVYHLTLDCRHLRKVLGTYIAGWTPGEDGRVHSTPGFWGKMFRISWRSPNIGATIADKDKEDDIAAGFRNCVATQNGRVLLEGDWQGIEAVLVGYFAEDADYRRLAKLGIHSFVMSHHPAIAQPADLSKTDEELRDFFAYLKKSNAKLYDDCKHIVHLTNYGGTPRIIAELYGLSPRDAKSLQDLYFGLFPKVRAWQKRVLEQAHQQAFLTTPFGYTAWFWDVFKWDSNRRQWALGPDAKSAISFLPRDTASAILRECILRLKDVADEGVLLSSTHDALLLEIPEDKLTHYATRLRQEMESPITELGGLVVGAELKFGKCWNATQMEVLP